MDKIVRIENRIVSVGKADGSLEEFDIAYFNFPPRIVIMLISIAMTIVLSSRRLRCVLITALILVE